MSRPVFQIFSKIDERTIEFKLSEERRFHNWEEYREMQSSISHMEIWR